MNDYAHFIIPFTAGVAALFAVILYKYLRWFWRMPEGDKKRFWKGIFTRKTWDAIGEVISESLLHRRIFRINPLLGYMHASLAFGWFLLIVVGWIETTLHLQGAFAPLHTHIFFKYFFPEAGGGLFPFIMDLLLLFVLSGVALAWFKRMRARALGMRRTTKHTAGDRIALAALWCIFPARLLAESATSAIHHNGSFLTGSVGKAMAAAMQPGTLAAIEPLWWWCYSIALALFFITMPFSRYMHIFTEIPLIFMRRYGIGSDPSAKSFDHFQIEACSRCGICIDPCQLQHAAGICDVQSVYFLRDRRYHRLEQRTTDNCLMCGRCEAKCPVGIELNTLRLNSRADYYNAPEDNRYDYLPPLDRSTGEGRTGYFAGCMTLLTPRIIQSMERIFASAGEPVWWADRDGGVCCGRPLKLSGEVDAAERMVEYNRTLFKKHGITTLVTSCPICFKIFREDYNLQGIEVLHHSQYIKRLIDGGRIAVKATEKRYDYHDPCELGRGSGIYDEPRAVIASVGGLLEADENREEGLCCGSGLANTAIDDDGQTRIGRAVAERFAATEAEAVVTACPLCKKSIARAATQPVYDLAEVVAGALTIKGER